MFGVKKELCKFLPDIKPEKIEKYLEHSDLMEAAEWDANLISKDEFEFYKTSRCYLWNHCHAEAMRGSNGDFQRMIGLITQHIKKGCKALDFGAGVGSAGLWLKDRKIVSAVDFVEINANTRAFLRHRLGARKIVNSTIYTDPVLTSHKKYDLILAYGVFEHMDVDALNRMFALFKTITNPDGALFMVNYFDTFGGDYPMHYLLDKDRKAIFKDFADRRTLIEGHWKYMEGEITPNPNPSWK